MIILLYFILGYWAVGRVLYADKVVVYSSWAAFAAKKLAIGVVLGWILIPVAIIKVIAGR